MSGASKRLKKQLKKLEKAFNESRPCLPCSATEHLFCERPDYDNEICCCVGISTEETETIKPDRIGAMKGADEITDVQSTGRKRAAVLYPFEENMVCEWANLKRAGGGVVPIVGCLGNPATARHHGPDKNTLNNKEGNVHRICAFCHNFWHAKNDDYYGKRPEGTEPFIPLDGHEWCQHDSETQATTEELVTAQLGRKQPKNK